MLRGALVFVVLAAACRLSWTAKAGPGDTPTFKGYHYIYGSCKKGFDHVTKTATYRYQCNIYCNQRPNCAAFYWKWLRGTGKYAYGNCRLYQRRCYHREYENQGDKKHITYMRVGHPGMTIPGFKSFDGKCPEEGTKFLFTLANQNPRSCAKRCFSNVKCQGFVFYSDNYCYAYQEKMCQEKEADKGLVNHARRKNVYAHTYIINQHKNLAFGKATAMSAAESYASSAYAVDGNTFGIPGINGRSCAVARHNYYPMPYFLVQLGAYFLVRRVVITNRIDDHSDKMKDFVVAVIHGTSWSHSYDPDKKLAQDRICGKVTAPFSGSYSITCPAPLLGKSVIVQMLNLGRKRGLSVCEIEVYKQDGYDPMRYYDELEGKYCTGLRMRQNYYSRTAKECALICMAEPKCGAFLRTRAKNRVAWCQFFFYGCEETKRSNNAGYSIFIKTGHPGMEVVGYTHHQGKCNRFKYFRQVHVKNQYACAAICNAYSDCEGFWFYYVNVNSAYCYPSKQEICDEDGLNKGAYQYHMYARSVQNVALGRKSYSSSTEGYFIASRATDGLLGVYKHLRTCFSSKRGRDNWWAVDLGFNTRVKRIDLYTSRRHTLNRVKAIVTDDKPRNGHALKFVDNEICDQMAGESSRKARLSCRGKRTGRYVVLLQTTRKVMRLILCEVVVRGWKDYNVKHYVMHEDNYCSYHDVVPTKKGLTPGDCADVCNKNVRCVSFSYKEINLAMQCWFKGATCETKMSKIPKSYKKTQKWYHYVKRKHPGLSLVGYTVRKGEYFGGYQLHNMYASPDQCAHWCNKNKLCHGIRLYWTSTRPYCSPLRKTPSNIRYAKAYYYYTFIKTAPNIAVGKIGLGVGKYPQGPVDGLPSGYPRHGTCFISKPEKGRSWWGVDLALRTKKYNSRLRKWEMVPTTKFFFVRKVALMNRADCCAHQMKQLIVIVTDNKPLLPHDVAEVCAKHDEPTVKKGRWLKLKCRFPLSGRYVVVRKEGNEPFSICEIMVDGWPSTDKNVAMKKKTDISSFQGRSKPEFAVDGKLNTHVGTDMCAQTMANMNGKTAWWSVDLAATYFISSVTVRSRSDCCAESLSRFSVSVSTSKPRWNFEPIKEEVCNYVRHTVPLSTTWSVKCKDPAIGRYVIVSQNVKNSQLTLCEVQVFGRPMKLETPIGFWPLTAGLKGYDVAPGQKSTRRASGHVLDATARPGPLNKPYTAFTIKRGGKSGFTIPSHRNLRTRYDFTILLYIYQSSRIDDSTIVAWDSGDRSLRLKNNRLVLGINSAMDNFVVTSKARVPIDRWVLVAASFDYKTKNGRVFVNDHETEKFLGKRFRPSTVNMDDINVGKGKYFGGIACMQLYKVSMKLMDINGAANRCKHYMKRPGDQAINIAKKKPAFQSSTWNGNLAGRAVDGDDAPNMWRKSCSSTIPNKNQQWWAVDLQNLFLVTSVKITNRLDCCHKRLSNFRVIVTTDKPNSPMGFDAVDVCAHHKRFLQPGQTKNFACREGGLVGKYVAITKQDKTTTLTLCEVQVFGEKVLFQLKKGHQFIWRSYRVPRTHRGEKKILEEVANLKLCQRLCLSEKRFKCLSSEYEYLKKRCRLFDERRRIKDDTKLARKAALEGWFVVQKGRKAKTPEKKKNVWDDLKQKVDSMKKYVAKNVEDVSISQLAKQRDSLIATNQSHGRTFKVIVKTLARFQKKLNKITKGQVALRKKLTGRLLPGIARSPIMYTEVRSIHSKKVFLKCPRGKNKLWSVSTNWVLNQAPLKEMNGINKIGECEKLCNMEVNFQCLSFAFNKELKTCALWDQNAAARDLKLVQKLDYTYGQWGCGGMPPVCHCHGWGDPHYRAFNGRAQDFQGPCKYTAAKSVDRDGECAFDVESKNDPWGSPSSPVSITVLSEVKIFGHVFQFTRGSVIKIDGRVYTNLAEANRIHPSVKVYRDRLEIPSCQLWVKARNMYIEVEAGHNMWRGGLEGYCGNCLSNNPPPYNFAKYEVPDDTGIGGSRAASCKKNLPSQKCTGKWAQKVRTNDYCGLMMNWHKQFGQCIRRIPNRNVLFNSCIFDVCQYTHNPTQARREACDSLTNLADQCANLGVKVGAWRRPDFCPVECGRNAEYMQRTSACPATCDDLDAPKRCSQKPKEGCACKTGYVLNSKRKCVVKDLCAPKSLADIIFFIDMSDLMGPQLSARAKDLVADIVDTFDISPKTTQISVIPYACRGASNTLLYSSYPSRPELVEAIRNLPFLGGCSKLPKALKHAYDTILTPRLEKIRPGDVYSKMIVLVTPDDVADNDAAVEQTKTLVRKMGKVFWFKYNSHKRPPARDLTIPAFIFPIGNPSRVDHIIDEFSFTVYKEVKCGIGMYNQVTKYTERCKDIDECRLDVCSKGSTCVNTNGGYRCVCPRGYCFHNQLGCIDNNECSVNPCLPGSTCVNTVGSYKCRCKKGFRYHPKRSCLDINECALRSKKVCRNGAFCENTLGSYACQCKKKGYVYKADFGCAVGDTCVAKKPCNGIAKCVNVKRGYKCMCPTGYRPNGKNGCQEIDLCKAKPCKGSAVCRMTGATFVCICPEDFEYTKRGCKRKDPCDQNPCKGNAKCTSENGEFYCACRGDMYYNPAVGCEEPEIVMPESKLVIILDGSGPDENKPKLEFPRLRQAALRIGLHLADKGENLNMGLIVLGGKPRWEIPQKLRKVNKYDTLFEDVLYKGGKFTTEGLNQLISSNKELLKWNTEKVIFVVITKKNIKWSPILDNACKKTWRKGDKKSHCHYAIALVGHTVAISEPSPYLIAVASPVELLDVWMSFKFWFLSWLHCKKGYVHNGFKCQKEKTVVATCKYNDELFAVGTVWQDDCISYKCLRDGPAITETACPNHKGRCVLANGVTKYKCIHKGRVNNKCTCTVRIGKNKEIIRVVRVLEVTAPKVVWYTDKAQGKGKPCVFPFVFENREYKKCTTFMSDRPWCATVEDLDHDMDSWGYCEPPASEKQHQCEVEGKVRLFGDTWMNKQCWTFKCGKNGHVTASRKHCPSTGPLKCVPISTSNFPCEVDGRNFETCVCRGNKGQAEYFGVVKAGTVQFAYGDADFEYFCQYGKKEVATGQTLTADCNTFKCVEERSPDQSVTKPVGATLERVGDVYCQHVVETDPTKKICIKQGTSKRCDKSPAGDPITCSCEETWDGPALRLMTVARRKEVKVEAVEVKKQK